MEVKLRLGLWITYYALNFPYSILYTVANISTVWVGILRARLRYARTELLFFFKYYLQVYQSSHKFYKAHTHANKEAIVTQMFPSENLLPATLLPCWFPHYFYLPEYTHSRSRVVITNPFQLDCKKHCHLHYLQANTQDAWPPLSMLYLQSSSVFVPVLYSFQVILL